LYTSLHMCVHIHIHVHIHTHTYNICKHTQTHTKPHKYIQVQIHTYICNINYKMYNNYDCNAGYNSNKILRHVIGCICLALSLMALIAI